MQSLAVAVPKQEAERVRQRLLADGLLRAGTRIEREGDTIYLPVVSAAEVGYPVVARAVRESSVPVRSYKEAAEVPDELRSLLPTSFDVIGDVAVVKVPDELRAYEEKIGLAILRANPAVRVVAADDGVRGPLRVRDLRVVAGPDRTTTVHREHGLSYAVDVARAYFSPRLGTERMRVAAQVEPGEAVVDLFAGVGPYAILIARRREPRVVYAFDANPVAFELLEENVRRNRAERVQSRAGDALASLAAIEPPDRVIIDYPQNPDPAFRATLSHILPDGVVHYYAILEERSVEEREKFLLSTAKAADRSAEVVARREVHGWSPTKKLYALDVCIV